MVRVKRGNIAKNRRKKILKLAKGFRGTHSSLFRMAHQQLIKSFLYSYIGRKKKKRIFRQLWIIRISGMAKNYHIKYNAFIHNLKKAKILLNRKMLSQLAILDPPGFSAVVLTSWVITLK